MRSEVLVNFVSIDGLLTLLLSKADAVMEDMARNGESGNCKLHQPTTPILEITLHGGQFVGEFTSG